jgi:hypothetical protein
VNHAGIPNAVNEVLARRASGNTSQLGLRLFQPFHSLHPQWVTIGQFFEDVEFGIHKFPRISFVVTAGDKGNHRAILAMELNIFRINKLWMKGAAEDSFACVEMQLFLSQ